jgi:hypothetical protein
VANSQDKDGSRQLNLLAAVVLHTLVAQGREGITTADVAVACERDPRSDSDMREIEAALELLIEDGLAEREVAAREEVRRADERKSRLFHPTRAAVRASELSF